MTMEKKTGLLNSLYQNLASIKLTVFIFLTIAVCSLIGTLLPQGLSREALHNSYSPGIAWWIDKLGLADLYHSGWFRLLLLMLCLNLVICTIQRLPKTLKLLKHREDQINPEKLLKFAYHRQISTRLPWDDVQSRMSRIVSEEFAALQQEQQGDVTTGVAEASRWSRLMVYVVHFSVLIVLFGAILGSVFGFKGFMNITEGDAADQVHLGEGHQLLTLPFQVRCDDFDVTFYDTGAPKEYRSDLTVIDKGKEVLKRSIRVNDPVTYQGVTFYQASYGATLKQAEVEFRNLDSGKNYQLTLPFGETIAVPDTSDRFRIVNYQQDFSQFGPAVGIALLREGQEPTGAWILIDRPGFHGNRIQNYQIKVISSQAGYFTGLQVKRDPGVWVVWIGFVVMLLGIGTTFYSSHRKLWVWAGPVLPGRESTRIILAGRTSRNSLSFERDFNQLCDRLQDELKSEKKRK